MPTGRQGRALALALLVAALAAIYLIVAAPLVGLFAQRQGVIEARRMLLPRLQATAAELPALRARIARLRAEQQTRTLTLDGATDAIASANLESRIDTFARSVGATIGSTESLPAEPRGPYRRIGLRLVLTGRYETLVNLLARLDTARPPLVVDNLQLHGPLARPGMEAAATLDAGLDVYGFRENDNAGSGGHE
jgi:general secretion pathway protein M